MSFISLIGKVYLNTTFWIENLVKKNLGPWRGNFTDWDVALDQTSGYDSPLILEKVRYSLNEVRKGRAKFERDSVLFYEDDFNFPLISSLLSIASMENGVLNVLDFGGSLGSVYFQNKVILLKMVKNLSWSVVEQKQFVDCGKKEFEEKSLKYFETIDECLSEVRSETLLLSSVIQYLKNPYVFLEDVINKKFKYIILDRTPFFSDLKANNRITIQHVPSSIYNCSYPCHIFNQRDVLSFFLKSYDIVWEFNSFDKCNLDANFKGYFFKIKEKI